MIKKVEIITNTEPQTELEKAILRVFNGVATKLNEIVDAVNELQEKQDTYWTDIAEIKKELLQTPAENVRPDAESCQENVQKEALTMALEALHAIAHWGPWKDDREEYAEKAHKKISELLAKGGDNE